LLVSKEVNKLVVDLFRREGSDAWYKRPASEILPAGTKCAKCSGTGFRKEMDIIDVWFESGSSQAAVLGRDGLPYPADLYLEGGDQHRGWFHSSLLCAIGLHEQAPFRGVTTCGWALDDQGRAQSKSLGNTVDPVDIAKRFGGEIVRLWVSSVDFREDVVGTEALMERIAENYRKIRNTFRYVLSNLDGFDPARDAVPFEDMQPLDQYMLLRTEEFAKEVRDWYEQMLFHRVYHRLNQFCVVDLSAIYFYVLKDRLYTSAPKSHARRSAQTAIWRIGEALVRLVAPIMTFTADEIWQYLPKVENRSASVHLELFPKTGEITGPAANAAAITADWDKMFEVREAVLQALEPARQDKTINDALEAKVTITAPQDTYELLKKYQQYLNGFFVVSATEIHEGPELSIKVEHAPGQKCERCWNYSIHVGEDKNYPTVCERCSATLAEIERG